MKKLTPNNITLEKIKNSNYWELIALVVWNHYRESRYQDESLIEITEDWYGKRIDGHGSAGGNVWQNENHQEKDYVRTLQYIEIKFARTDYNTYILINVEDGNIRVYGIYNDKNNHKSPTYNFGSLDVTNWMIDNDLLRLESDEKVFIPKIYEHDLNDKNNIK